MIKTGWRAIPFSLFYPILSSFDRAAPVFLKPFSLGGGNCGGVSGFYRKKRFGVGKSYHSRADSGGERGTSRGRFSAIGNLDRDIHHIRAELHKEFIAHRASVTAHKRDLRARVALHTFDKICDLLRHRLVRGADDMRACRSSGQTYHRSACVWVVVRCA